VKLAPAERRALPDAACAAPFMVIAYILFSISGALVKPLGSSSVDRLL
jgi:hypothetical protein